MCEIEDNGVGRGQSTPWQKDLKEHKSMATIITQERINVMNEQQQEGGHLPLQGK